MRVAQGPRVWRQEQPDWASAAQTWTWRNERLPLRGPQIPNQVLKHRALCWGQNSQLWITFKNLCLLTVILHKLPIALKKIRTPGNFFTFLLLQRQCIRSFNDTGPCDQPATPEQG